MRLGIPDSRFVVAVLMQLVTRRAATVSARCTALTLCAFDGNSLGMELISPPAEAVSNRDHDGGPALCPELDCDAHASTLSEVGAHCRKERCPTLSRSTISLCHV